MDHVTGRGGGELGHSPLSPNNAHPKTPSLLIPFPSEAECSRRMKSIAAHAMRSCFGICATNGWDVPSIDIIPDASTLANVQYSIVVMT